MGELSRAGRVNSWFLRLLGMNHRNPLWLDPSKTFLFIRMTPFVFTSGESMPTEMAAESELIFSK